MSIHISKEPCRGIVSIFTPTGNILSVPFLPKPHQCSVIKFGVFWQYDRQRYYLSVVLILICFTMSEIEHTFLCLKAVSVCFARFSFVAYLLSIYWSTWYISEISLQIANIFLFAYSFCNEDFVAFTYINVSIFYSFWCIVHS